MYMPDSPQFSVISGDVIGRILEEDPARTVEAVRQAYLAHGDRQSINPPSSFLRFPERPESRIIALPASLGGSFGVDGIKWISSFPQNIASGIPRASAVLILNDQQTGYPFACLESSIISATRTAASAALAAAELHSNRTRPRSVTFFGTGLIARYIHTYLRDTGWEFATVHVHDHNDEYAQAFRNYLTGSGEQAEIVITGAEAAVRSSNLVVFATTAGEPHVTELDWLSHNPVVLHISLRDLSPEIILSSANVVDDAEHCLKANTSPHLAHKLAGHAEFINGTLSEIMSSKAEVPTDRPLIFSPFGLGVLDLAVGISVYREARAQGLTTPIPGFFHDLNRYA
ncbi:2,3-diaminopropionate biosynthesis protein SbnB [Streptomyces cucumeris]|uniref:2,3-diaminopropionate biosynthesis protein SbnB n=1 Tax=Streptomyces cucumeris TaxID=2962890 RepID=UPI0020C8781B|nr:2,3-diaminopropionate biosynthesis protein SbnB [Streptomyces sp. NEAU-Y11]MCP9211183.1 2,3-diaminopropionate biosynthesis protein SbnB [Streptomyces sp. NEAU-Y11]